MHKSGGGLNGGDILHLVQIAILLISLGATYEKFQETETLVGKHSQQLDNIEHYLSSKDKEYWERVK